MEKKIINFIVCFVIFFQGLFYQTNCYGRENRLSAFETVEMYLRWQNNYLNGERDEIPSAVQGLLMESGNGKLSKSIENGSRFLYYRQKNAEKIFDQDYKKYNSVLKYTKLKEQSEGGRTNILVEEDNKWNYAWSKDTESEEKNYYKVELAEVENEWKIVSLRQTRCTDGENEDFDFALSKRGLVSQLDEMKRKMTFFRESMTKEKDESIKEVKLGTSSSYSRSKAVTYAVKYALNYNPNYPDYNGATGGDCTNYISQCLYAGGIKQHYGTYGSYNSWYFKSDRDRSGSWTKASYFQKYIHGNNSKISATFPSSWYGVEEGDIIQIVPSNSATHSMIITGVVYSSATTRSDLLICCHTSDKKNVSFNANFSGREYAYYHIKGNK